MNPSGLFLLLIIASMVRAALAGPNILFILSDDVRPWRGLLDDVCVNDGEPDKEALEQRVGNE